MTLGKIATLRQSSNRMLEANSCMDPGLKVHARGLGSQRTTAVNVVHANSARMSRAALRWPIGVCNATGLEKFFQTLIAPPIARLSHVIARTALACYAV